MQIYTSVRGGPFNGNVEEDQWALMLGAAREAQKNAYAPYSCFRVGVAILVEVKRPGGGHQLTIYRGGNVENASYGLTQCAERTAICTAMTELGATFEKVVAVLIVSPNVDVVPPCGACRQVLMEFGDVDTKVRAWAAGTIREYTMDQLLPHDFSAENLDG